MSSGNNQSKFKSKLIVSFGEGSGNYKLIECKGDSCLASTFNGFICSFSFVVVLGACYKLYAIHRRKKSWKFQPKRVPENTSNENKHYMICSTTKVMYNVFESRVANCLCCIFSKVVFKEGMMHDLSNL